MELHDAESLTAKTAERGETDAPNAVDAEALAAKTDEQRLNNLIESSREFILGCASKATRRYITESDDEWSVAVLAFSEAVKSYDEEKGGFRGFAAVVIKRRLIDHFKSEIRFAGEIPMDPYNIEGEAEEDEAAPALIMEVRQKTVEMAETSGGDPAVTKARDEIEAAQQILREYGFSFFELTECSPKAEKTKRSCALAAKALLESDELMDKMRRGRTLPIKEMCEISGVPRKIVERHRKYIIAAAEIISGDFPILSGYLNYIRKALGE